MADKKSFLLDLKPTVVTKDLCNKYILLYGRPKAGKTSFAASLPNNLFLATEKGTNALAGLYVYDISTWGDFKKVIRELADPDVQAKFKTVTIDTVTRNGLLYCEV